MLFLHEQLTYIFYKALDFMNIFVAVESIIRIRGKLTVSISFSTRSTAQKIHVSSTCKVILDKLGGFNLEERGLVKIKVSA